jgi:hypothetical protein
MRQLSDEVRLMDSAGNQFNCALRYEFATRDIHHDVQLEHENAEWRILLDGDLVLAKKHGAINPLKAVKHNMKFQALTGLAKPEDILSMSLCAKWIVREQKWDYSLYANGFSLTPTWTCQNGSEGIEPFELFGPPVITIGAVEFPESFPSPTSTVSSNLKDDILRAEKLWLRVRCGTECSLGNQDAGKIGTTVPRTSKNPGWVRVRWPNGKENEYRVGAEGKFDLCIVDQEQSDWNSCNLNAIEPLSPWSPVTPQLMKDWAWETYPEIAEPPSPKKEFQPDWSGRPQCGTPVSGTAKDYTKTIWEGEWSQDDQRYFFFNPTSGETSWAKPSSSKVLVHF